MIQSRLARPLVYTMLCMLFTVQTASAAQHFADSFDDDRDFLAQGVSDSGWDGFLGQGPRETADQIVSEDGVLTLQCTRGRYQEGWDPLGPLLYKTVNGDFKATVHITEYQRISFNNAGIMARAANFEDAGKGEDWISIDYFPLYAGIYARMADDNRRTEPVNNGQGRNADTYLQMELVGNLFFLRHSVDGTTWKDLANSPMLRPDLAGIPLQVGLFQATYSDNQGKVCFDDFSLDMGDPVKTARLPFPKEDARNIASTLSLSWVPGSGARFHDVYVGSSAAQVRAAHAQSKCYKGRKTANEITHALTDLLDGTTYYWRVDEVTEGEVHTGQLWSFSTFDPRLAHFEAYPNQAALAEDWSTAGTSQIKLSRADAHSGQQCLQINYDNREGAQALVEHRFDPAQDWFRSDFALRSLRIQFKGNPTNQVDTMALVFTDADWGTSQAVVPYRGDLTFLRDQRWHAWDVDLQELVANNPSFRLSHVQSIGLRIWGKGAGKICVDDVTLKPKHRSTDRDAAPNYIKPKHFVQALPFDKVRITGGLWRERMEVNRQASLSHVWGRCEHSIKGNGQESKRLDNFRKVAGEMPGDFTGTFFNDSDVYKIIEGTAYSLQNHPDAELEAYTDKVIDSIAGAQWEDGYLYTFYSLPQRKPQARWTNVGSMHELYCAGHLFEGAVAYYQATGKRKLLDVAVRFANLICDTFGPGKLPHPPGHQEIELALVKLYQVTGHQRYLDTAKFFIDQRGHHEGRGIYGTYSQDHIPFIEQEKGVGHSVRAGYLYCGAIDVAMLNHDEAYGNALTRIWDNVASTKTYLTGGLGQPGGPEGFTDDYLLGNSCYAETCSGIAYVMWNQRWHRMTGQSKFVDLVERTLLNNTLSSLSRDGKKHFYTNPLTTNGRERWEWPGHDCACCPSNLVRVISTVGGYAYSHTCDTVNVNMYIEGKATLTLKNQAVGITQSTDYPWDGDIRLRVHPETPTRFSVKLRIPGWAQNRPMPGNLYKYIDEQKLPMSLAVNGKAVDIIVDRGYVTLSRRWQAGDTVQLLLPMPIRRVVAHPKVSADRGLVAVERGPIVYCAEFKDNDFDVSQLKLSDSAGLEAAFESEFLGGAVTLSSDDKPDLKLIPYYLYANRGPGWMRVWMPRK
jgi:uncharacterized protein